jgi:hypothetical protein
LNTGTHKKNFIWVYFCFDDLCLFSRHKWHPTLFCKKNVFLEFVAKLWFLLPVEFFIYKQDTKCSSLGAKRVWPWSIVFYPQHIPFVFLNTTFFLSMLRTFAIEKKPSKY